MRILVTGSSGFIGTHLVQKLLDARQTVLGADRHPPSERKHQAFFSPVDLLDARRFKEVFTAFQPEAVVHLAARTDLEEKRDLNGYASNIQGVRNLFDSIAATPSVRRCIITSSQLVCRVGYVPRRMDEYCPDTLYGESKVLTETIVRENDGGGVAWCLVRPTTVWGPHMSPHYQRMLGLIKRGRYFHCGKRKLYKSYAYVGNIAWQYLKLLEAPTAAIHRQTFYLADYEPLSLVDYADALAREMGAPRIPTVSLSVATLLAKIGDCLNLAGFKSFPFNSFRLRNILTEYVFNLDATRAVCGPLPWQWEEGVRETVRWFRESEARRKTQ